jgi:acetaldehyde/propanal dehydrogenase
MTMEKIACAVIGSGNIGTDLIYKLMRSPVLRPAWVVGIDEKSEGLQRARALGVKTTAKGIDDLLPHIAAERVKIAFDATSAYAHAENARKLNALGVQVMRNISVSSQARASRGGEGLHGGVALAASLRP